MSKQLDYYQIAPGSRSPEQVACALAEKAFGQGYRVHLQLPDEAAVAALDELLWTFRADSFVPHQRLPATTAATLPPSATADAPTAPVTLSSQPPQPPGAERSLLLLLGAATGDGAEAFQRIAVVIAEDDATAAQAIAPLLERVRAKGAEVREHLLQGAR